MSEFIENLFDFSRAGNQPVEKKEVDLNVNSLPVVKTDPDLLKQVMVNLTSNGMKYSMQ